jgi:hypothetical protein
MKSWFKKPSSTVWVPVIQDTTLAVIVPAGRIGLQVHGGGRFAGAKGTWYRNIKYRGLDDKGNRVGGLGKSAAGTDAEIEDAEVGVSESAKSGFAVTASMLTGAMDQDYSITVQDIKGRILESLSGKAGSINHAFATDARGLLILKVGTARGVQSFRVVRPF